MTIRDRKIYISIRSAIPSGGSLLCVIRHEHSTTHSVDARLSETALPE